MHADAAADGVDRWRRLVGLTNAQCGVILPLQRRGDLLDMRQRFAHFMPSGDHDAVGIEDAKAGKRDFLRLQHDRHQVRADLDIERIGRRGGRPGIRASHQEIIAGKVEGGPDRRDPILRIWTRFRRQFRAEANAFVEAGLHLARIDGCQHSTLRDQLRLCLADELVVVETEKEQPDQRQRRHRGEHGEDDETERGAPFLADRRVAHVCGSQRPSLKPTP